MEGQPGLRLPNNFCLACGAENTLGASRCAICGGSLGPTSLRRRQSIAFVLNDIFSLRQRKVLPDEALEALEAHYRSELWDLLSGCYRPPERPAVPSPAERAPAPVPGRAGPRWLIEQEANLLLYLGAFLVVTAALVFVAYSRDTLSIGAQLAMLFAGTVGFLAAGLVLRRYRRVREAGIVFFTVGAVVIPLDFVAVGISFEDAELDHESLWLAGSLAAGVFYTAVAFLGMGRWYPLPAGVAVISAALAAMSVADVPGDWYMAGLVVPGMILAAPAVVFRGRVEEVLGKRWSILGHGTTLLAATTASVMILSADPDVQNRWAVTTTLVVASAVYWSWGIRRPAPPESTFAAGVALSLSGIASGSLVYALEFSEVWYGPAVLAIGAGYALAHISTKAEWWGHPSLLPLTLIAITFAWFGLTGVHARHPVPGAWVHFAAAAFYLVLARFLPRDVFRPARLYNDEKGREIYVTGSDMLIYAAGLTAGVGVYWLLEPAGPEKLDAAEATWAFAALGLAFAVSAATSRWWWPQARVHFYVIAAVLSLVSLLNALDLEGDLTLALALFTAASFGFVAWEREALALVVTGLYGYGLVLAAFAYYEPPDAFLPLPLSAIGLVLGGVALAVPGRMASLQLVLRGMAAAYLLVAPVTGWVRLADLADPEGFLATGEHFEETDLYVTTAVSVLVVGIVSLLYGRVTARIDIGVAGSAVIMLALLLGIGHFNPENVQWYTAPLGLYLFGLGVAGTRAKQLPYDWKEMAEPLTAVGAAFIMSPSAVQSLEDGAWRYGLVVLFEGLAFVGVALVQRWPRLLATGVSFVVFDGLHYLFFEGPPLPTWALLAIAGLLVMTAGTILLFGRERWSEWQASLRRWWYRQGGVTA